MEPMKKVQFAEFLAAEGEALLLEHLDKVEKAALEGIDENDDKPVKAKVTLAFTWEIGASAPSVDTKISYTTSHKDETSRKFDPDQMVLQKSSAASKDNSGDLLDEDTVYELALSVIRETQRASTSMLQRRLRIGYNRAARLMERLEKNGVVGPENGSSPREILPVPETATAG